MNENKKRSIIVILIAVLVGLLSGLGFYNINKDKSTEEVIQGAVNEIKDYISTYEMSEKEIEELPSTEIVEQSEENENHKNKK